MDLLKKFKQGEKDNTYQRIDTEYSVNIFVGYSEDSKMSVVLTECGKKVEVNSTNAIRVRLNTRSDGKMALSFDLIDEKYRSFFIVFCEDIIENCEKAGSQKAITHALGRWEYWQEMFKYKNRPLLSDNKIRALISQLLELKNNFLETEYEEVAILGWMCHAKEKKDFEIKDTWYQVKAIKKNANKVMIDSIDELESDIPGHLIVTRLESSNDEGVNIVTLNKIIAHTIIKIKKSENLQIFNQKLGLIGYSYNEGYDCIKYEYFGTERYTVNEDFPRIKRKDISKSIDSIKYTILLDGIIDNKED